MYLRGCLKILKMFALTQKYDKLELFRQAMYNVYMPLSAKELTAIKFKKQTRKRGSGTHGT